MMCYSTSSSKHSCLMNIWRKNEWGVTLKWYHEKGFWWTKVDLEAPESPSFYIFFFCDKWSFQIPIITKNCIICQPKEANVFFKRLCFKKDKILGWLWTCQVTLKTFYLIRHSFKNSYWIYVIYKAPNIH